VPDDLSEDTIKLVLTNNVFPALDSSHLRPLTRLKFIDLSNNHIRRTGNGIFCTSEKLEILKLNNNEIEIISSGTFYCLKNLRRLNLKNNKMSSVYPDLFRKNTNLVVLDLSYNRIKSLASRTFQQNLLLSYVFIENNPVSNVSNFPLLSKSLNVLDIKFCEVPSIISYQRYLILESQQNMAEVKDLLPDDLTTSDRHYILNAMKPKLDALSYKVSDYLFQNTTMHTVTTYSGAPVFCYCNVFSVWYWCIDEESKCSEMKDAFHHRNCNAIGTTYTSAIKRTANGQIEAKPILPILVLILVVLILVTV
jgi:Leucine-rich repeat (LRR) protein